MHNKLSIFIVSLAVVVTAFGFFTAHNAHAAIVRGGETYTLPVWTELSGDLYFLGGLLTLQGTTTGDVSAVGSQTIVQGSVGGDALLIAGRVTHEGVVEGDARLVGGEVRVSGVVTEDLVVLGGNVLVTEGAVIEGDLLVYGDFLRIEGEVQGVAEVHVRSVEILGRINHDIDIYARESVGVLGKAEIGGTLRYTAPRKGFISGTASVAGEPEYTKAVQRVSSTGFSVLKLLLTIAVYVFAAVVLTRFFPQASRTVVERALEGSVWHAVRGFVLIFAWPVIGLVLLVGLIGLLPGIFFLCLYGMGVVLSMAFSAVFAGAVLAQWLKHKDGVQPAWAALGGVSLGLLTLLPVVGWFVRALLLVLMFGTLSMMAYEHVWVGRNTQVGAKGTESKGQKKETAKKK